MTERAQQGGRLGGPGRSDAPEVVLHRERLQVTTDRVAVERVRVHKRIVTTTRTIEVAVRVEQLVVTREPLTAQESDAHLGGDRDDGPDAELVLVLHEEVPEVTLRVVPVERVVVRKQAVRTEQEISAELHTEVADVTTGAPVDPGAARNTPR